MPTFEPTATFDRDFGRLTPAQQSMFRIAVQRFVHDLKAGQVGAGLRVKPYRRRAGWFEMTWAPDGRAPFRYGEPVRPGDVHIIWDRIGTHAIFEER